MAGIDGQSLPRYPFGGTIFAILFKTKCVHGEHTRISEHARLPLRQDLGDAIAEQEASAQAKVERMCGHERENIARIIDDDRAIKLGRGARIPSKPSSSSNGVTMGPMIRIGAGPHDKSNAGVKLFLSTCIIGAHNQCGAQTVSKHRFGIICK